MVVVPSRLQTPPYVSSWLQRVGCWLDPVVGYQKNTEFLIKLLAEMN
jgi:hypothetical protein